MFTPAFERYVAPARQYPQLWRLVLGLALLLFVYLVWMILMGAAIWLWAGSEGLEQRLAEIGEGGTPVTLLVLLASFGGLALGSFAAVRLLHRRSAASLFGRAPVVMRDFVLGVWVLTVVYLAGLILWPGKAELVAGVDLRIWLAFMPAALLGIALQTGAEELVFRGYLQQQLAARFASPLAWMVLPSILFGLVHFDPGTMGANAWYIVLATGVFALVAADLTARSGSLGLAWGLHFANNFFALMFISAGGGLDGLALYRLPHGPDDPDLMRPLILADVLMVALIWAICRLILRAR